MGLLQVPEVASTLIHQILSVIAERGGIRARPLYDLLCGPGPFAEVSVSEFAGLLRHLASDAIKFIEQSQDGLIMLAEKGEQTVQSRSFFAVFESAEEWRLTVGGKTLKFYLNGIRADGIAFEEIGNLDRLLISYGAESDEQVRAEQLSRVTDQSCIPSELCIDRIPPNEPPEQCSGRGACGK